MKKMDNSIGDNGLGSTISSAVIAPDGQEPMDIVEDDPSSIGNGIDVDGNLMAVENFRYQKENRVLRFLPYYDVLSLEMDEKFEKILREIRKAVLYRDFELGLSYATKSLQAFITGYGLRFSKEQHINLIHLYYDLLTMESCPIKLSSLYAEILNILLKKPEVLTREDLQLDWRPLYEILDRFIYHRKFPISTTISTKLEALLKEVVRNSNCYFKKGTVTEVIREFKSILCPTDSSMHRGLDLLKIFLPYLDPEAENEIVEFIQFLLAEYSNWSNHPSWEWAVLGLFATTAVNMPGVVNWNPYLPTIYGVFLKNLKLPVRFKNFQLTSQYSPNPKSFEATIAARFIVSTLGNNEEALNYFRIFLKSLETYYNPNNYGRYSASLISFLMEVVVAFARRLKKERFLHTSKRWWLRIDEDKKLTPHDVEVFVTLTSNIVLDFYLDLQLSGIVLKMLAEISPNLIIPAIIEKYSNMVETLTEPKKYIVTLKWVLITLIPLIGSRKDEDDFDGRSFVFPFLNSLLPAIDPNDIFKTVAALSCIYGIFSYIPIVDCSQLASDLIDEEEKDLCLATAGLEDWILQFIDRVFVLIESRTLETTRIDNRTTSLTGTEDTSLEKTLWAVFHRISYESSTPICKSVIAKFVSNTFETIYETEVAGKIYCSILQTFALGKPHLIFPVLLPKLCSSVVNAINDDILDDEELDRRLSFHLQILSYILESDGTQLLKYREDIDPMLEKVLKLNGKKGFAYAGIILKKLLLSLTLIYPTESRLADKNYDDPSYLSIKDWGISWDIRKSINCEWHLLQRNEIDWARDIFSLVYEKTTQDLKGISEHIETNEKLNKILLKRLHHMQAVVDGCHILLPFFDKITIKVPESVLEYTPIPTTFGFPEDIEITVSGGENAKLKYFEMLKSIYSYVSKFKQDDVDIFNALSKGFDSLIFPNVETERRLFTLSKSTTTSIVNNGFNPKKKHNRLGIILRVFSIHNRRLMNANSNSWTNGHMEILSILFEMTMNRYYEIRLIAQMRLTRIFDSVGQILVRKMTPRIIEKLKEGVEHHEFKGVLYALLDTSKYGAGVLVLNSIAEIRNLWLAVLKCPNSERMSILKAMTKVKSIINQNFVHGPFEEVVPQSREERINELANSLVPFEQRETKKLTRIVKNGAENREIYQNLLGEILEIVNDSKTHWRKQILGCTMLNALILKDIEIPAKMIEFFFESLVSQQIELRHTSLTALLWILSLYKREYPTIFVNTEQGIQLPEGETLHSYLQFKLDEVKQIQVSDENDKGKSGPLMIHKTNYGYFGLPLKLKIKLPIKDYSDLETNQSPGQKLVLGISKGYFESEDYLKKIVKFWILEEKSKSLGSKRANVIKLITRNNGPNALKMILGQLPQLVCEKDQWKQRCSADLMNGILTGMKLWDPEIESAMWREIEPLLSQALDNATQETLNYWSGTLSNPTNNRDANKMRYYLLYLKRRFEKSMEGIQLSSVEAFKDIALYESGISNLQWRGGAIFMANMNLAKMYLTETSIPYVNVRIQLGRLLSDSFEWDFEGSPLINRPRLNDFVESLFSATLSNIYAETEKYEPNVESPENEVIKGRLLKCKTIIEWLLSLTIEIETTLPKIMYKFIPLLAQYESFEADPELSQLAGQALSALSKTLVSIEDIGYVLNYLEEAANCNSWRARLCVLEFLKVFALNNECLFATSEDSLERILGIVLKLLSDRKLDVRTFASKILSGFIHCQLVPKPLEMLEKFKGEATVASKKFKRRKAAPNLEDVDKAHSSILGLCSFIDANPYSLPEYLPQVIIFLANRLHDPQPIPQTIKTCLSSMKRTHLDNWAIHKQKFNEEELSVLTDVFVSPCYYA